MPGKFTPLLAAVSVTFVGLATAAPAVAAAGQRPITVVATAEEVPVRLVSYRDLNLVKAEDEQILVTRVRYAAKDVCAESVPTGSNYKFPLMNCRANAWRGAQPQIERAVTRARDIAANGWSAIAPVAITISAG